MMRVPQKLYMYACLTELAPTACSGLDAGAIKDQDK